MVSKSTELTLKKIGDFLSKLAERSEDVYWLSSPDFKSITYLSPAYEKIWGRSREDLYNNPEQWISFLAPEDAMTYHPIYAMAERIAESGPHARYSESYRIVRPDGQVRWILDRGFPIYNDEGECCGVTGVAVDITIQKEAEAKLREAKEAAEAASSAKSDFIRNMSHDIRTPLAGIIGMADIINRSPEAKITQEGARDIHQAGLALLNLLNEIIETTQLESGDIIHKKSCFALKETVDALAAIFRPAIKQKGLKLEAYYDDNIPEILYGQELLLHRIILNLLGNAVKFTQHGAISLEVSLLQKKVDKVSLKLVIKDTGIGIPADKQEVIFDKFSRLTSAYTNTYKGSGLGLYMVKEFIKKLGGEIKVNSAPDRGAQFTCTVQFKLPTPAQLKKYHKNKSVPHMEVLQGNAQKPSEKLHTLLVEDTLLPRKIAENLLMEEGYEVVTAQTAQEALEQSNQKTFDLILMDVGLPDGNGIDVAKAIRENPKNPNAHTFIVALTAHSDPDIKTACLNVGMQAVVDKPLNLEKIKVVVARINQSEKGELPIIDLDSITQSMGGNIQLAKEMLDMLMKELPKFRQEITDAFVKQDWAALKHHVHKLHGGLCYSGAVRLKDATRDFEKQLIQKAGPFDEYYQTLIDEINKTLDEYNK